MNRCFRGSKGGGSRPNFANQSLCQIIFVKFLLIGNGDDDVKSNWWLNGAPIYRLLDPPGCSDPDTLPTKCGLLGNRTFFGPIDIEPISLKRPSELLLEAQVHPYSWSKIGAFDQYVCNTGWSKATVTSSISLARLKITKNGITQPFLESLYAAILIFQCLSMVRWQKLCLTGLCLNSVFAPYCKDWEPTYPPTTSERLQIP